MLKNNDLLEVYNRLSDTFPTGIDGLRAIKDTRKFWIVMQ